MLFNDVADAHISRQPERRGAGRVETGWPTCHDRLDAKVFF
jgi:hypothetical protein